MVSFVWLHQTRRDPEEQCKRLETNTAQQANRRQSAAENDNTPSPLQGERTHTSGFLPSQPLTLELWKVGSQELNKEKANRD